MNSEPWLIVDDHQYEVLVGNREGLIVLKEHIENAINSPEGELNIETNGIAIEKIILTEKNEYKDPPRDEKWWGKILICLFATWFLILPFVAIVFIINLFLK